MPDKKTEIQFLRTQVCNLESELDDFYKKMKSLVKGWSETLEMMENGKDV